MNRTERPIPEVSLPDGTRVPALGLGTWRMGERARDTAREIDALKLGLDFGMRLVDTAEMYGEGRAEEIVGEAIAGRRDDVFLVSKVYPHNASRNGTIAACERSLARLRTGHLDLYLLHWRGDIPLAETVASLERLKRDGKIRYWGVSNFDDSDMQELFDVEDGAACASNQVLYHLDERGVEWSLLPLLREQGIPTMAYSPLGQGALARNRKLRSLAHDVDTTPSALALAWLIRQGDMIVIPKASDVAHVHANRAAVDLELDNVTLARLDEIFPPPVGPTRLAMI